MTIIEYRKTGGIAGVEIVLKLDEDGKVSLRRSISGAAEPEAAMRLDRGEAGKVLSLAEGARFSALRENYGTESPHFDGFTHEITCRRGERENSVRVGAPDAAPEGLRALLEQLDLIVRRVLAQKAT